MPLNLPASDQGNRIPIIKYDARAGRIFRVDRTDVSGRWDSATVEIPQNVFQAVFDLEAIETGWLHFPTGSAPDIRTAILGKGLPDKPSDKHRPGYRLNLLLGKQSGGDLREMAANAKVSVDAMKALYDLYEAGLPANPGLLPVVKLASTIARVSQGKGAGGEPVSSTNYEPVWQIVKWVPRPAELQPGYVQQQAHQQTATPPPPQQAAPAPPAPPAPAPPPAPPPPPPAAAPAPVLASVDDDF